MRRLASILAAMVIAASLCGELTAENSDTALPLDGQAYEGHMVVAHTGAEIREHIAFEDGELRSEAFQGFGFADGPYSAFSRNGEIRFQSFGDTAALGYVTWTGTIMGDTLTATVASRDPGEPEVRYIVSAKRVLKGQQRHSIPLPTVTVGSRT